MGINDEIRPGLPILADTVEQIRQVFQATDISVDAPLEMIDSANGRHLRLGQSGGIWARLFGDGPSYNWVEVRPDDDVYDQCCREGGEAYEVNGFAGLDQTIQWLVPGFGGDWRFQSVRKGTPTPTCAATVINIWDRINGGQATGLSISIDYINIYNAPGHPYKTNVGNGPPGTNFGVLPTFSYYGYYAVTVTDTENNYVIPVSFNGQGLAVSRCRSLDLQFCKITIDVATEDDAVCEAYVPDRGTGWGIWVTPTKNVSYYLTYGSNPPKLSDTIYRPITVVVSVYKEGTLGNCKEVVIEHCGEYHSIALPLYHYEEKYVRGLDARNPDCSDVGCLVRGPGPEYSGVISKVLTMTISPYWYSRQRPAPYGPEGVTFDDEPTWRPRNQILGSDWGTSITVTYDPALGLWDSGPRGGNGLKVFCGYNSYGQETYAPITSTRLYYGHVGAQFQTPLCRYEWSAPGCGNVTYSAIIDNVPVDCCPTDLVYAPTVSDNQGNQYTYTWFGVHE